MSIIKYASIGDLEKVTELISLGVNINVQDRTTNTALIMASVNGYPEIVKVLIRAGANVNLQNGWEDTALFLVSYGVRFCPHEVQLDIVKALVKAGAIISKKDIEATYNNSLVKYLKEQMNKQRTFTLLVYHNKNKKGSKLSVDLIRYTKDFLL